VAGTRRGYDIITVGLFLKKIVSSSLQFETFERWAAVTKVHALGATNLKPFAGPLGHIPFLLTDYVRA